MKAISKCGFVAAISILILFHPTALFAQSKSNPISTPDSGRIEIRQADYLEIIQQKKTSYNNLFGNVILAQKGLVLYCDTAQLYKSENIAHVHGHVHFIHNDSLHAYGDSAFYDGNNNTAVLYGHVKLTDETMSLETDELVYDMRSRIATYSNGGKVYDAETELTSQLGYYYVNSNDAFFKHHVVLVNPDYRLEADTLQYNTSTERAIFHGPTHIYNEKSEVTCLKGYYDTNQGIAVFHDQVTLKNPPQSLKADSIYYNRATGIGKAYGHIEFSDTAQNALQYSNIAYYNEIEETILSTSGSVAGFIIETDTLFIAGDTIRSETDSLDRRSTFVYHHVRIYKSDLQGVCDSLVYRESDSTINLFQAPVLWSDSTQFTADTIVLFMENGELSRVRLFSSGFIVNEDDSLIYNQVKGRNITGYFVDQELYKIEVVGNGESIYYGKDDNDAYIGVNKLLSSDIDIYVAKRKFTRISFKTSPEGEFYPMDKVNPAEYLLQNFKWLYNTRPRSKADLFEQIQSTETSNPSDVKSSQKDG